MTFERDDVWLFSGNRWMRFQGRFARTIEDAVESGNTGKDLELLAQTALPGAQDLPGIIGSKDKRGLRSDLVVEQPSVLFIEITDRCNLSCKHCYTNAGSNGKRLLKKNKALTLISEAGKMNFRRVQLTGGEPLLHPNIKEFVRTAFRAGVGYVEIFTNGHFIDDEFLNGIPEKTSFALSFYCSDLEIHDQITGQEGSGKKTLAAIDLINERGFEFRVATVMMKENAELWKNTRDFLIQRGVPEHSVGHGSMNKVGRGDYYPKKRGDETHEDRCNDDREHEDLFSWPGKACVSSDGDVSPCIFARWVKLGSIHDRSLRDILESPDPFEGETLEVPERWRYCAERLSCPDCRFLVFGLMGPRNG